MMESPGRVAFSVFGFDVMWYGIMIATGIVCAFLVIYYRAPKYHGISKDRTFNLVIFILITALVGTRIYYVAFEWQYYSAHPAEIFDVRAGGLAIHGGLIAGCLMAALLARIYKEKFLNIVDLFFVGIPLGQAIGRWGNFFNSEAHGTHTDLPWAVIVNGDTVQPTFLYESIWCVILFLILWRVDNKRKFNGQIFFLYCILYSIERFFVEGLRTDSLMVHFPWGEYRQAQVLSICAIIFGGIMYIVCSNIEKKKLSVEAILARLESEDNSNKHNGDGSFYVPVPAETQEEPSLRCSQENEGEDAEIPEAQPQSEDGNEDAEEDEVKILGEDENEDDDVKTAEVTSRDDNENEGGSEGADADEVKIQNEDENTEVAEIKIHDDDDNKSEDENERVII